MEESIKWNYVVLRSSTEDELEIYGETYTWDGATPEDDETVFVSDGKTVWVDTWVYYSKYSCTFDGGTDLEEFYWAPIPIPKPPIKGVNYMELSGKVKFIAHGNASGLCDSGLSFKTAYDMEMESLKTWSDEEIETEYALRKEYLERGGLD